MQIMPDYPLEQSPLFSTPNSPADGTGGVGGADGDFARELARSLNGDAPRSDASYLEESPADEDDPYAFMADAPYNTGAEPFSAFVPQDVRLTPAETETLADAMAKDGAPSRVVEAVRGLASIPGGPSMDQVAKAVREAVGGKDIQLSKREENALNSLAFLISGQAEKSGQIGPDGQAGQDTLAGLLKSGNAPRAMDQILNALKGRSETLSLSREEMAALTKALQLPAASSLQLMQLFQRDDHVALSGDQWHTLLGQAKLDVDKKAQDMNKALTSLEKNAPLVFEDAARREALERQTAMGEERGIGHMRTLIRDKATQAAPGRDDSGDKSGQTRKSAEAKGDDSSQNTHAAHAANESGEAGRNGSAVLERQRHNATGEKSGRPREEAMPRTRDQNAAQASTQANDQASTLANAQDSTLARSAAATQDPALAGGGREAKSEEGRNPFAHLSQEESALHAQQGTEKSADSHREPRLASQASSQASSQAAPKPAEHESGFESAFSGKQGGKNAGEERGDARDRAAGTERGDKQASVLFASQGQGVGTVTLQNQAGAGPMGQTGQGTQAQPGLSPRTLEQIEQALLTASRDGTQRLEVALNPLELGSMTVILTSNRSGEISAVIQPERAETAQLITQQVDKIKAELENQGFKVEKVDVQTQLDSDARQNWQGTDRHNATRDFTERSQQLERLRLLGRSRGDSSSSLAHDMQNRDQTARAAEQGLHIVA